MAGSKRTFEVYIFTNGVVESKREFRSKEDAQEFVDSHNGPEKNEANYASIVY